MRQVVMAGVFVIVCIFALTAVRGAQQTAATPAATPQPKPAADVAAEEDPTKPIVFSIRDEYRNLKGGAWSNIVLFRLDKLTFRSLQNKGGAKGLLLRFDVPFNTVHLGTRTESGLGDLYAQALYIPYVRKGFALAVGTGMIVPTATSNILGTGKLVLAPAVIPVWPVKKGRLYFIRFQNYFSVAGKSDRPDINYFVADPTIVTRLTRKWWATADTEFRWNWRTNVGSGITGFQIGRVLRRGLGFWVRPEIPWGSGRVGDFNLKFIVFRIR